MKKEFIQTIFNKIMLDKLTSALPFLRKEKFSARDLDEAERGLQRNDIFNAFKNSGQDPQVVKEMALMAFDDATAKMRVSLSTAWDQMIPRLTKEK